MDVYAEWPSIESTGALRLRHDTSEEGGAMRRRPGPERVRPWIIVLLATAGAFLAGCREAGPSDEAASEPPLWGVTTSVHMGGSAAEGPAAFGLVRDAALLLDPVRVAVADWQSQGIRVFEGGGRYLETVGRRGGGPGEYEGLSALDALPTGELVGWDGTTRRITLHLADGDVVIATDFSPLDGRRPAFVGALHDTTFVFALPLDPATLRGRPEGVIQDTVPFVRVDATGGIVETMARVPASPVHFYDQESTWGTEEEIFGASLLWTATTDRLIVVPGGDPVLSGYPPWNADPVTLEVEVRQVTAGRIAAERRRRVEAVGPLVADGVDLSQARRDVIAALPAADRVPAFEAIVGGEDGSVWLKRFTLPTDSVATWLIADGAKLRGRLHLPLAETLTAGSRDMVVTVWTDELGAPVVSLHLLSEH